MKKYLLILLLGTFTINSFAACKWVWVEQDYNTATAPIPPRISSSEQKQVCDSTLDIKTPSIQPIQNPKIQPIQTPSIPPIGTTKCRTQSVYENGQWMNKKICS